MDKLKEFSKWIKFAHAIVFTVFLLAAAFNVFKSETVALTKTCNYDSEQLDYKCWADKHANDIRQTERAGIKGVFVWLPIFGLSMFGLWQFIRLMGSFQTGLIFSHENFLRMRWIGRIYIALFAFEEWYILLTQMITKALVPNLPPINYDVANGSSELMTGLMFLMMAYAVQAAVEMKQELEQVV